MCECVALSLRTRTECTSITWKVFLSRCQKQCVLLVGSRIKSGSELQSIGPATENGLAMAAMAEAQWSPLGLMLQLDNYGITVLLLILHPFNGLFFQDNLGKPVPERQNPSGFKWGKRQWRFGTAVASSGPCKRSRQITKSTPPSLNFYKPDALPDAQPTVSKHWRQWYRSCTRG